AGSSARRPSRASDSWDDSWDDDDDEERPFGLSNFAEEPPSEEFGAMEASRDDDSEDSVVTVPWQPEPEIAEVMSRASSTGAKRGGPRPQIEPPSERELRMLNRPERV